MIKKRKKGQIDVSWPSIFSLLILVFILAMIIYFIALKSSGEVPPEVMAKDLCLLTLTKSGTKTVIETNFTIEAQADGLIVKASESDTGFFYPCSGRFEITKQGNKTTIYTK